MTELPEPLTTVFGGRVTETSPLQGGELSRISLVTLDNGRKMVVKRGPLVETEGRMLAALTLLQAPVPAVLHLEKGLLCLEYLPAVAESRQGWRDLGTALARLHSHDGAGYGWQEDYAFGDVAIDNATASDWPGFWAERRLLANLRDLPADLARRVDSVAARIGDILPAGPRAAPLHGDLWSGNLLFTQNGPYLVDPACYHGHCEVDLAMLTLFGEPDDAFWRCYGALEPGAEERRAVYQLWPALVHLRLFGESYRPMVTALLDRIGA